MCVRVRVARLAAKMRLCSCCWFSGGVSKESRSKAILHRHTDRWFERAVHRATRWYVVRPLHLLIVLLVVLEPMILRVNGGSCLLCSTPRQGFRVIADLVMRYASL